MRVVRVAISHDLGVDVRAARPGALVLLEHEYRASFAHHEAVSVSIEGAGRALWLVVARGHRAYDRERAEGERRERRFRAAAEHDVRVAVTHLAKTITDRDGA